MPPSNYTLDNFVAHKLSLLTECGAKEPPADDPKWFATFILNSVFVSPVSGKPRHTFLIF